MAKRSKKRCEQLPILHPHAAGIDVSASELFVAVSADRDSQPIRSFPTFTRDLNALADWLQQYGIRSVAMESTSVYWIPVYQILESGKQSPWRLLSSGTYHRCDSVVGKPGSYPETLVEEMSPKQTSSPEQFAVYS